MLKASGIYKSFDGKEVLKGVDIQIAPGTITALIGPSGTGKTTLLRALGLLDYPDKGTISIDGQAYNFPLQEEETITPPWPKVTVVFQSLFLWPHLTLRENMMLPARNRAMRAPSYTSPLKVGGRVGGDRTDLGNDTLEQIEKDMEGLIKVFEMEHFINHYPNQASIGQRQRVALARALILNPQYILMDEITAALDIEQTARILTKLEHLKERGIGVFIITHQIGFARRAADSVVFMDGGMVVESGAPQILTHPSTTRLKEFLSLAAFA